MTKKGWLVSIPGPRKFMALTKRIYSDLVPCWQVANEIAKPQVSINSNNSSIDCKKLQPEMEICNRKQKLSSTRVVKNYSSSTRVLAAALVPVEYMCIFLLKRRLYTPYKYCLNNITPLCEIISPFVKFHWRSDVAENVKFRMDCTLFSYGVHKPRIYRPIYSMQLTQVNLLAT